MSLLYFPLSQSVHAAADDAAALNVPAAQAVTFEPDPVKPASARQSSSASEAAGLPELVGQPSQEVCAVSPLYVPLSQSLHVPGPAVALNLPATQSTQVEMAVASVAALDLPASHWVHASEETAVALNVPAAQAMTLMPSPVNPASAKQSDSASEPVALTVFL